MNITRPEDLERELTLLNRTLNDYRSQGRGDDDPSVAFVLDKIASVKERLRFDSTPRIAGQPVGKPTE